MPFEVFVHGLDRPSGRATIYIFKPLRSFETRKGYTEQAFVLTKNVDPPRSRSIQNFGELGATSRSFKALAFSPATVCEQQTKCTGASIRPDNWLSKVERVTLFKGFCAVFYPESLYIQRKG